MIFSFIYIFINAAAMILVQYLDATIPPMFSLFITTFIAILYFNLLNYKNLKSMYAACFHQKSLWIALMISVLVMRGGAMIAPGIIGASLHGFLYFSWLGTLGFISLGLKDWQKNRMKFYCGIGIIALIAANIFFEINHSFSINVLFGLACSLVSSTSAFIYFKQSQMLLERIKLPATQILAVRFYLTLPVAFLLLPSGGFVSNFTTSNLINLIFLAFISMIIPLYFSQKALEKISSEQNAIIMSLCPTMAAILQEIIFKDVKIEQGIIYVIYAALLGGFYCVNKYTKKSEVRVENVVSR